MDVDTWYYNLGVVPDIGNIDPDILIIKFRNGVVVEVKQKKT